MSSSNHLKLTVRKGLFAMKIVRIYQEGRYELGETLSLSPAAVQHVALVMRMRIGEQITLFRGDNREFLATILQVQKREVIVRIEQVDTVNRESPRGIHLAQGISKGERMEWVIQKAVELGVTSITPILTERSVVRLDVERTAKKEAQWQSIAIHACEQCGRNQVPTIHPISLLEAWMQQCQTPVKWILHPEATQTLRDHHEIAGDMTVLIGPEGGFSAEEFHHACEEGFHPLRLGPRILRTETAAITAMSLLQATFGDLDLLKP